MYRVGIIGCGLIGTKRASNLGSFSLAGCADIDPKKAEEFSKQFKTKIFDSPEKLIESNEIEVVFICTLHDSLFELTKIAMAENKHILVEKPGAKNLEEVLELLSLKEKSTSKIRVGFNHRYHRAFRKLDELIEEDHLGDLMFLRSRYGHGGRLGYEKEWRADLDKSGGGELIDQGPHLIDLSRKILGEFEEVHGTVHTYFWDMEVDDNAFLTLTTSEEKVAFLHVSCTEWKNTFSMEVYGKKGKAHISGLGGSYGVEKLIFYKMSDQMGPPETQVWEYPMEDDSWQFEIQEFFNDIKLDREPEAGLIEAKRVHQVIKKVYDSSN